MKIKTFIYSSAFALLLTSNTFAVVSTPAPSVNLSQVASSMSFSSTSNNNVPIAQTQSQTSNAIDAEQLKDNVTSAAEDAGLKVDTAALDILASSSGTGDATIFSMISDNINSDMFSDDKKPTLDADTMVFKDSDWNDLTKVTTSTVTGLNYSAANKFFDANGVQQGRGATFVNIAKGEISAKFWTRFTRANKLEDGVTNWTNGGSTVESEYFTGVAGMTAFPVSGTANKAFLPNGNTDGSNFNDANLSILKNQTTLNTPWREGEESGSSRTDIMNQYNNKADHASNTGRIFLMGKAVIADGSSLQGTIGVESGSCANSCTEAEYAATVERWEFQGNYVGEKWDGKSQDF